MNKAIRKYIDDYKINGIMTYPRELDLRYAKIAMHRDIEFWNFLKENKAYSNFMKYIEDYFYDCLSSRKYYIESMISWDETDEKYDYWAELNGIWLEYIKSEDND